MNILSVLSKKRKKSIWGEEKLKKKLKSKPKPPQIGVLKHEGASVSKIHPALKLKSSIATISIEALRNRRMSSTLKQLSVKKLKPKLLKLEKWPKATLKPIVPRVSVQVGEKPKPKVMLKPEMKVELKLSEIPKTRLPDIGEMRPLRRQPPKIKVEASVKPLTRIELKPLIRPTTLKPQKVIIKGIQRVVPRPVEREELMVIGISLKPVEARNITTKEELVEDVESLELELPFEKLDIEGWPFEFRSGGISPSGLPSDSLLICAYGMMDGLEALRKLYRLEMMDRGRCIRPDRIRREEIEYHEEELRSRIKKDDLMRRVKEHRLITLYNWDSISEVIARKELLDVIKSALESKDMKYILLEIKNDHLHEESVEEIEHDLRLFFGEGNVIGIGLMMRKNEIAEKAPIILEHFSRILNVSKRKLSGISKEKIIELKSTGNIIDKLWGLAEGERGSAIYDILSEVAMDPLIRRLRGFDKAMSCGSDEHKAMELLVAWFLLKKYGNEVELEFERDVGYVGEEWELMIDEYEEETVSMKVERVFKRPDLFIQLKGREIWVECETLKNRDDPLDALKWKLHEIINVSERIRRYPNEIWIVIPYRKYVLYGERIKECLRPLHEYRKKYHIMGLIPRLFIADLRNKRLLKPQS